MLQNQAGCRGWGNRPATLLVAIATAFLLVPSLSHTAQCQTYGVLYNFTNGRDGGQPAAGPTLDRGGNLYGTAFYGGDQNNCASGCGVVYKLTLHNGFWVPSTLYSFTGLGDGALPYYGAITLGPDGTPFGTTYGGGINQSGVIFDLRPRPTNCPTTNCPWIDITVHQFGNGNDGFNPTSGVIFDAAGNMYGTTYHGGTSGNGAIYEATRSGQSWTESVIYNFAGGNDGSNPVASLTLDSAGNLYGTTYAGGTSGFGTVFKVTHSGGGWTKTVLYNFTNGNDGRAPSGGVVFDPAGNLYGSTVFGGTNGGGTLFELSPNGASWTLTTLYSFSGVAGPYNNLTMANGVLYGTTYRDGANQVGSVFKLTQSNGSWTFTNLHDFTDGSDGGYPTSSVAVNAQGDVFGTASSGGSAGQGVVFEITP